MNIKTYQFSTLTIVAIFFILATTSISCESKKDELITCPICYGSGRYNSPDIFMSQMACTGCLGNKVIKASQLNNILQIHTPSTPDRREQAPKRNRQMVCPACQGKTVCPVCNGMPTKYGRGGIPISRCNYCKGAAKCPKCYGSGIYYY